MAFHLQDSLWICIKIGVAWYRSAGVVIRSCDVCQHKHLQQVVIRSDHAAFPIECGPTALEENRNQPKYYMMRSHIEKQTCQKILGGKKNTFKGKQVVLGLDMRQPPLFPIYLVVSLAAQFGCLRIYCLFSFLLLTKRGQVRRDWPANPTLWPQNPILSCQELFHVYRAALLSSFTHMGLLCGFLTLLPHHPAGIFLRANQQDRRCDALRCWWKTGHGWWAMATHSLDGNPPRAAGKTTTRPLPWWTWGISKCKALH